VQCLRHDHDSSDGAIESVSACCRVCSPSGRTAGAKRRALPPSNPPIVSVTPCASMQVRQVPMWAPRLAIPRKHDLDVTVAA